MANYECTKIWLEFVSRIFSIIISWPVVILIISLIFKETIIRLVSRLANIKFGNNELNFIENLHKINTELEESGINQAEDESAEFTSCEKDTEFEQLARLHPAAAIIVAWIEFESMLRKKCDELFPIERASMSVGSHVNNSGKMLETLLKAGKIDKSVYKSAREMQKLRNLIIHAQNKDITEEMALSYCSTIKKLKKYVNDIV